MSLFIANLAFGTGAELDQAKIGVLAASVVAALAGLAFLRRALPRRQAAMAVFPPGISCCAKPPVNSRSALTARSAVFSCACAGRKRRARLPACLQAARSHPYPGPDGSLGGGDFRLNPGAISPRIGYSEPPSRH